MIHNILILILMAFSFAREKMKNILIIVTITLMLIGCASKTIESSSRPAAPEVPSDVPAWFMDTPEDSSVPEENIKDLGKGWYEATAWVEYHEDITKAQAKEKAISRALKNIIEFYSGV